MFENTPITKTQRLFHRKSFLIFVPTCINRNNHNSTIITRIVFIESKHCQVQVWHALSSTAGLKLEKLDVRPNSTKRWKTYDLISMQAHYGGHSIPYQDAYFELQLVNWKIWRFKINIFKSFFFNFSSITFFVCVIIL